MFNLFTMAKALATGQYLTPTPVHAPLPTPAVSDSDIEAIIDGMWNPHEQRGYVDEGGWVV